MMAGSRIKAVLALAAVGVLGLSGNVVAKEVPAVLPDPDVKPGDASKPVKVYILAGQSNMVGMGEIRGARCRYTGIYLTPDPAAPKGPMYVYSARAVYRIMPLDIYRSADPDAEKGATASLYKGAFDPAADYDKAKPVKTQPIPFGLAQAALPTIPGPHTCVVRAYLEVPESGEYIVGAGHADSSCNITLLDGREVYRRKQPGGAVVRQSIRLEAGKRYPLKITYLRTGSTAFWLSRLDLVGKGDLESVTKRDGKFPHLVDDKGNWTVRNDVYYYDARVRFKGGPLSPTANSGRTIGPELGFGHVVGHYHDEQVLLIKTAMGNRALGFDFRPPSSGRKAPDNKWESREYRLMIEGVHKTLDNLAKTLPGYKGQGYEIAGFVWWQGHKDSFSEELIAEYEKNLVNLIKDVRKEFKAPKLPVVIATVGFHGFRMPAKFRRIWQAQMNVADPKKHPEFAGTVRTVDTRPFWRDVDNSPANQDYHYNRNAETYLLVGDALGRAMVDLLEGRAPKAAPPPPFEQLATAQPKEQTEEEKARAQAALAPIVLDGMIPAFVARNREALLRDASGERPKRVSPFLRDTLHTLADYYRAAGIHDYDWHPFGPDLRNTQWHYYSFDPPERLPKDSPKPRFRKVTFPAGMENWFAHDFDPAKAGWKTGLPPFGQKGGKLEPLRETCTAPFCRCSIRPRTLWEKEVLLVRKTFECPPLKKGCRYRIVVGGSAHVNAGEGYAIYVNGKKLIEYPHGVGKRQGGQPRGSFIWKDFLGEFQGGKLTVAAISFLRYYHPRDKNFPPQGHLSLWLEEMKLPPVEGRETAAAHGKE